MIKKEYQRVIILLLFALFINIFIMVNHDINVGLIYGIMIFFGIIIYALWDTIFGGSK